MGLKHRVRSLKSRNLATIKKGVYEEEGREIKAQWVFYLSQILKENPPKYSVANCTVKNIIYIKPSRSYEGAYMTPPPKNFLSMAFEKGKNKFSL